MFSLHSVSESRVEGLCCQRFPQLVLHFCSGGSVRRTVLNPSDTVLLVLANFVV